MRSLPTVGPPAKQAEKPSYQPVDNFNQLLWLSIRIQGNRIVGTL